MTAVKQYLCALSSKIAGNPLYKRILGAAFWSFAGAVAQKFLLLSSSFLCVYILGKGDYGRLSIVRSTIQLFILLGSVGMGSTATKFIAEYRDVCKERLKGVYSIVNFLGCGCGLLVTILVLLLAPQIAAYLKEPELVSCIRIGALLLCFAVINSIQLGILTGVEKFKEIAAIAAIGGVIEFACLIGGAWIGSVTGALIGYGLGFLFLTVLNQYVIAKAGCPEFHFSMKSVKLEELKKILFFGIPLLGSSLLVTPVMLFIQMLLVRYCSFEDQGVYAAADQWRIVLLFVPSTLSRIILPMLANMDGLQDNRSYVKILKMNLYINAGVTVACFLGFMLICPIILKLYRFPQTDFWIFVALAGSTIFGSLAAVFGQAIVSKGKNWIGLGFNLVWGIMVIALTFLFLKIQFGALALSLAILISYLFHTIFQGIYFVMFLKHINRKAF